MSTTSTFFINGETGIALILISVMLLFFFIFVLSIFWPIRKKIKIDLFD